MAKSKRGGRDISNSTQTIATPRVIRPTGSQFVTYTLPTTFKPHYLDDWGVDRRTFNPTRSIAPPAALNRNATRIVVDSYGKSIRNQTKAPLRFSIPQKVALCVRRKIRSQVLHAFNKTGKGKSRRRPRRNFWSAISC